MTSQLKHEKNWKIIELYELYELFILPHYNNYKKMPKKIKCRKRWRGGLKETIELMLIRPPQLQFFQCKNMTNCERTRCFLGHNSLIFRYCDHILLLGAKIELSRVGEVSLAEHV